MVYRIPYGIQYRIEYIVYTADSVDGPGNYFILFYVSYNWSESVTNFQNGFHATQHTHTHTENQRSPFWREYTQETVQSNYISDSVEITLILIPRQRQQPPITDHSSASERFNPDSFIVIETPRDIDCCQRHNRIRHFGWGFAMPRTL